MSNTQLLSSLPPSSATKSLLPHPSLCYQLPNWGTPTMPLDIGCWSQPFPNANTSSFTTGMSNIQSLVSHSNPNVTVNKPNRQNAGFYSNQPKLYPCDTCKVGCASFSSYQMHIKSQAHLKKVERAKTGFKPEEIKCELCMITVTSQEHLRIHQTGAKHKKNEAVAAKLGTSNAPTRPIISSASQVQESPTTSTCLNARPSVPKTTTASNVNARQIRCELCNIFCDTQAQFNIHLTGKKHKANTSISNKSKSTRTASAVPDTRDCVCSDLRKVANCYKNQENIVGHCTTNIKTSILQLEKMVCQLLNNEKYHIRHSHWPGVPPTFLSYLSVSPPPAADSGHDASISEVKTVKSQSECSNGNDPTPQVIADLAQEHKHSEERFCSHTECCEVRALRMYEAWLKFQKDNMDRSLDAFKTNLMKRPWANKSTFSSLRKRKKVTHIAPGPSM